MNTDAEQESDSKAMKQEREDIIDLEISNNLADVGNFGLKE